MDTFDLNFKQLVGNVLRNIEKPSISTPLWVLVMERFAIGSTKAHFLCRYFGRDPDENIINPYIKDEEE